MKSNDVQLNVARGKHTRAEGPSQELGRLARMPAHGLHRRRRNHARHGPNRGITMAIGLVSVMVVIVVSALWMQPRMEESGESEREDVIPASEPADAATRPEAPVGRDVVLLVRRAVAVESPLQAREFFRLGGMNPAEAVSVLRDIRELEGGIDQFEPLGNLDANGLFIEGVRVRSKAPVASGTRVALLVADSEGRWRVDLPAYIRRAEPAWSVWLAGKAEQGVLRVQVEQDHYFNGLYADDREWACYGIASPDVDSVFNGYCRKGSEVHEAMERMIERHGIGARLTLEVSREPGSEIRQLQIVRVAGEDWAVPEEP